MPSEEAATPQGVAEETEAYLGFEAKLWRLADALRNNMDAAEYKHVVLAALGEPASRQLIDVLSRSQTDRYHLIGRRHVRVDAAWLADLLIEIETDPDDLVRLRLIAAVQRALSP